MAKSDKAKIIREYMPEYPDPIEVVAGERVSVGNEDAEFPGWVWCRSSDGREGWVPAELLSSEGSDAIILENYSARELAVHLSVELPPGFRARRLPGHGALQLLTASARAASRSTDGRARFVA